MYELDKGRVKSWRAGAAIFVGSVLCAAAFCLNSWTLDDSKSSPLAMDEIKASYPSSAAIQSFGYQDSSLFDKNDVDSFHGRGPRQMNRETRFAVRESNNPTFASVSGAEIQNSVKLENQRVENSLRNQRRNEMNWPNLRASAESQFQNEATIAWPNTQAQDLPSASNVISQSDTESGFRIDGPVQLRDWHLSAEHVGEFRQSAKGDSIEWPAKRKSNEHPSFAPTTQALESQIAK
jgi:hypothetical protein